MKEVLAALDLCLKYDHYRQEHLGRELLVYLFEVFKVKTNLAIHELGQIARIEFQHILAVYSVLKGWRNRR